MTALLETIAGIRTEKGLTQREVAKRIGVHWVTLSKLERGEIELTARYIFILADVLECHPARILFTFDARSA